MPARQEPTPLHSTRRMLDELDALMDQMLALPVNDLDAPEPNESPAARVPAVSASPHSSVQPSHLPGYGRLQPVSTPPTIIDESARPWQILGQRPKPEPFSSNPVPSSVLPQVEAELRDMPTPKRSGPRSIFILLLRTNETYDRATELLGSAGTRLRGGMGRAVIGVAGLAFLATAVLWLLNDWLGWTG